MTEYILKRGYKYELNSKTILDLSSGISVTLILYNKERDWIQIEYNHISVQIELHEDKFEDWLEEIPEEQRILTAEEWSEYILQLEEATQTYKEIIKNSGEVPPKRLPYLIKRVAKDSFEEGDKNGWNRTKELRDAISEWESGSDKYGQKVLIAFNKLKTPQ